MVICLYIVSIYLDCFTSFRCVYQDILLFTRKNLSRFSRAQFYFPTMHSLILYLTVIEHQLFSFISINWRAKPLTSLAVILELISHTTTKSGLTVKAMVDTNTYTTGIKVTDQEIEQLNIKRDEFHGEWNYTISPQ